MGPLDSAVLAFLHNGIAQEQCANTNVQRYQIETSVLVKSQKKRLGTRLSIKCQECLITHINCTVTNIKRSLNLHI